MTWTEQGLLRTWRALKDAEGADWVLSPLHQAGPVVFHAGRHFPGSREAVIVDFPAGTLHATDQLPAGGGFDVLRIQSALGADEREVIALLRLEGGDHDLFTLMAVNVLRHVEGAGPKNARGMFDAFIVRVRDWQDFMANKRKRPLSMEQQAGLMGELLLLEALAVSEGSALKALDAWKGPVRAAQDFQLGGGAIEVKSTACLNGFIARINSIEQLDGDQEPLFFCAAKFREDEEGETLAQCVARLRTLTEEHGLRRQFDALAMFSGYHDEHADRYGRRLALQDFACHLVDDAFPRLSRAILPAAVRGAKYDLDVTMLSGPARSLAEMLSMLKENDHDGS